MVHVYFIVKLTTSLDKVPSHTLLLPSLGEVMLAIAENLFLHYFAFEFLFIFREVSIWSHKYVLYVFEKC